MRRLLRETRPDVVHAHWMPIAGLGAPVRRQPARRLGLGIRPLPSHPAQRWAYRHVVRHADVLMGSSLALVDELQELGAPTRRTVVVNWGVDLRRLLAARRRPAWSCAALGLPSGPMILGPRWLRDVYNPQDAGARLRPRGRRARRRHVVLQPVGAGSIRTSRAAQPSRRVRVVGQRAARADGRARTGQRTCASRSPAATGRRGRCGRRWHAEPHASSRTCRGCTS